MTNAGTNISQRSIVLLPFPFTDLSTDKKRPAFVASNTKFNNSGKDVICCLVTSNPDAKGVKIKNTDMESGLLKFESTIKPYRLFTADKSIIYKVIGKLKKDKSKAVVRKINALIRIESISQSSHF